MATGGLWVTTDQGANRFHYADGDWLSFTYKNSGLIEGTPLAVALEGDQAVWFGTAEGLSRYDIPATTWLTITDGPRLPWWLNHCAQLLHVDRYGALWVGTDEGLYRRTPEGGWIHLTTADGLASNHVLSLYEDPDGTLWIGTPSGTSRLDLGP